MEIKTMTGFHNSPESYGSYESYESYGRAEAKRYISVKSFKFQICPHGMCIVNR